MPAMLDTNTQYFATLTGEDLLQALRERRERFEQDLYSSQDYERMKLAVREYYGEDEDGGSTAQIQSVGSQDQLRKVKTGTFRNVLKNKLTIAKADSPTYVPVARNLDHRSQAQVLLAKGIIQHEMAEGGDEAAVDQAVESAEVMAWAWLDAYWDELAGMPWQTVPMPEGGGRQLFVGEPKTRVHLACNVAFDFGGRRDDFQWVIIRYFLNKFDVAAQMKQEGRDDNDVRAVLEQQGDQSLAKFKTITGWFAKESPDEVPVYEFRHIPTPAVPNGRLVRFTGSTYLRDSADPKLWPPGWKPVYPYVNLHVQQVKTSIRIGTPRGYTQAHDALGLQKAIDVLTSIPYSNARALGGNFVWKPAGCTLNPQKLTEALTILEGGNVKPEVLNLLRTGPEVFDFRQRLMEDQRVGQGMDSLSMGADNRDLSAKAMALLDTRTQRAVSDLATTRTQALKWIASAKVRLYRDFAAAKRALTMMVGRNRAPLIREFSRADVAGIADEVVIETASPLLKQPAGRVEVGNVLVAMAEKGMMKFTPEQYITLLETGRYEAMTDGPMAQTMAIRAENERLAQGEALERYAPPVMGPMGPQPELGPDGAPRRLVATAMFTDDHPLHIKEHAAQAANPEARGNPAVMENIRMHVQAHLEVWRGTDPALLAALGLPPPPMPMPLPGMVPPGGETVDGQVVPPGPGGGKPPPSKEMPPNAGGDVKPPTLPNGEAYSPTGAVNA